MKTATPAFRLGLCHLIFCISCSPRDTRFFNRSNVVYASFCDGLECGNEEQKMTFRKEICEGMRHSGRHRSLAAKSRREM